ncbi:MAG TPA: aldose 1-epimerase [Terriglobia bacterium]|nr:aldose 1-epimerase [Terriglobia bacterium]
MRCYDISTVAVEGHRTFHLLDLDRRMDFGVVPDIGNVGYKFTVNGQDAIIPIESFGKYLEERWFGCGIPFLAPYANRIDHDYYFFGGNKYLLNNNLGNLLRTPDTKLILHGLLAFDPRWEVVQSRASDDEGATLTSRLEFYRYPDLMAQFPFAHTIQMTFNLKDGKLKNTTTIHNLGRSPMPVHVGYHPYFRVDGTREEWVLCLDVKTHWIPNDHTMLLPTGEKEHVGNYLQNPCSFRLGRTFLDDNFSDFNRDVNDRGSIRVRGRSQQIEVVYGREYDFALVFAPLKDDKPLICIEPQTGPTNALNLNHEGKFKDLVVLDPGATCQATFWIVPTGF